MFRMMMVEAVYNIWLQRKKYLSTIAGIMVGVFAIVVMQFLGNTLKGYLRNEFKNDYYFMTLTSKTGDGLSKELVNQFEAFHGDGVQAIVEEEYGNGKVQKDGQSFEVELSCVSNSFFETEQQQIKFGKKFSESDYDKAVCIISDTLYGRLFNEKVLKEKLQVYLEDDRILQLNVIGTYKNSSLDEEEIVYLPEGYLQDVISDEERTYESVLFSVDGSTDAEKLNARSKMFIQQNKIKDKVKIQIDNDTSIVISIIDAFSIFISIISVVCFIIGEINIMCMMFIRVKQSINEIGIRKAVGARKINIFQQYFSETLILSFLGYLIGVFAGLLCSVVIVFIACIKNRSSAIWECCDIPVYSMVGYFFATIFVGSLMGIYPAIVANRMNVIEALKKR